MNSHFILLAVGGLLLLGLVADEVGHRARLPRVTLLVLFGIAAGPSGFDLLPRQFLATYELLASIALTMVAFLLGGTLSAATLRRHGRQIIVISLVVVVTTVLITGLGLWLLGAAAPLALLLAGIATATDPSATRDVVRQLRARGPFTDTLLGIVAIDDAWGLILFSLMLVAAKAAVGDGSLATLGTGLWEVGGALAIGAGIGLPAAYLTGRIRHGEPMQSEAIGVVFICAGLSIWAGVSFLLAGMVTGAIVVNLAKHHKRAFHEIEHIEWPFMLIFFTLAGASLKLDGLAEIGAIGFAFIALRLASRCIGGLIGGKLAGVEPAHSNWIGVALMPQAGVALGMALMAGNHFGQLKETLLAIAIGTTVIFEVFGPILTQWALRSVGESKS